MAIKKFEEFNKSINQEERRKRMLESLSQEEDDLDTEDEEDEDDDNEEEDTFGEDYIKYDDLLQGKSKERKKIANNTYAVRLMDGSIAIRLYDTDVVTLHPNGDFKLNHGGFATATTFSRINEYIPQGYRVMRTKGQWFLHTPNKTIPFENNMIVKRGA